MERWNDKDPAWVDAILDWRWTWPVARLGLCGAYLVGGCAKLFDFPAAIAEQEHFGLRPGAVWAVAAIVVELGGSSLVIWGRFAWLGAGAMGVLTALATCVAYDFWHMQGHERFMAMNGFFEHLGLIAGLVMAVLLAKHDNRRHQPTISEIERRSAEA